LRRVFGLRFLVEAAFIALVAALVWYEDVAKPGILGAIAGAWLLVALAEWLLSRREFERPVDVRHVPGTEWAEEDTSPLAPVVPVPQPEPEPEPDPELEPPPPAAERVVTLPAPAGPREWNVWELERLVRETAGADVARDEERSFLLMYMREFADPDGMLPVTFDPLVRETFGDVLGAVRP
jgi:hypothetical protein